MKKYMVYLDDGSCDICLKIAVSADNEKKAREYASGNGEVIAVKDVTDDYPISQDAVRSALASSHFGTIEIDFIVRCLIENKIIDAS